MKFNVLKAQQRFSVMSLPSVRCNNISRVRRLMDVNVWIQISQHNERDLLPSMLNAKFIT